MRELLGIDEDLTLAFPIGVSQLIQGSDPASQTLTL